MKYPYVYTNLQAAQPRAKAVINGFFSRLSALDETLVFSCRITGYQFSLNRELLSVSYKLNTICFQNLFPSLLKAETHLREKKKKGSMSTLENSLLLL